MRHRDRLLIVPVVLCTLLGAPASAVASEEPEPPAILSDAPAPFPAADAPFTPFPAADPPFTFPAADPFFTPFPAADPPFTPFPAAEPPPGEAPPAVGADEPVPPAVGADEPAPPAGGADEPAAPAAGADQPELPTAVEVARLYADAAKATDEYERGRRAADAQRVTAEQFQSRLSEHRARLGAIHDSIGGVAREQYRTGGSLANTARLLLADSPDTLLRGYLLAAQAERAVKRLLEQARRAEGQLARAEEKARAAWRNLAVRKERLAVVKRGIETKLETAQWKLQSEADSSVAAGKCAGAVRLEQPAEPAGPEWVTPVERYSLSAGFNSTGERWARRHTGQDFAVDIGAPVRSVGAGRVVSVSCGGGFGIEIVVQHPGGYYSQYAHLAGVSVDQGEQVRTGQWIGQAGTTGNSTGPHLHFEVRLTPYLGSGVDPVAWLQEHGVQL
ncbi:peptidoglycan DD-metalloendopeptidase family protein [Streptomyces sp. ISL-10]|uniref:peptidoglycan DD-metalloendopeptidase family protein n=1 Tax=Streptomyces sp. ISL-10 TaxID=2819172 RepID=UPI002035A2AD|nr:peptidoglycan DD-metalloendopeptidase family protein [Streptomyces sp. ISL-10]